jgi:hypothetical protein
MQIENFQNPPIRNFCCKFILLVLAVFDLLFYSPPLFSQNPDLNKIKYDHYRKRLLNNFLVSTPDNQPGTNIPASFRDDEKGLISWGDATIFLSNYISVLATEYRVFKNKNENTKLTLSELYYAMQALERLDISAESFFDHHYIASYPNGFFIRDDVPADFSKRWKNVNPSFQHVPVVNSDFTSSDIRTDEMSQDQVWHILLSLALVRKLVDDTMKIEVLGEHSTLHITFKDWAKQFAYRMVKVMQHQNCYDIGIFWEKNECYQYWIVKNPVTNKSVKRGSLPLFLKYGFAEAGNWITEKDYGDLSWAGSKKSRIWFNITGRLQKFQTITQDGDFFDFYNCGALATVGNIWNTRELVKLYKHHHKMLFIDNPQYEHFALISYILHKGDFNFLLKEKPFYENLLNVAPEKGPFNYGFNSGYIPEWSCVNRLVWPERLDGNTKETMYGDYNGLDYLLLYNLYELVYK